MLSTTTIFNVLLAAAPLAAALPQLASNPFNPAGPGDRTSPCPMVNTLANHGFLPRENVSMDILVSAFDSAVGLEAAATRLVGALALKASTTGDATTFNLDDLNRHGFIEHDGSLSRQDVFFGDNHSFNETIWRATASHFTDDKITLQQSAAARKARLADAKAVNPQFNMTAGDLQNSFIESALYQVVFGEGANGNARKDWVRVLFEEERLPYQEGWTKGTIAAQDVLTLVGKLSAM